MAGESLNDKQAAAYTANAAEIPAGGVRIVGTVQTSGSSSSSPAVQPVSVTSGFPIIQPVSVTSGFPIIQPVSISSGFPVIQPVSISSGFPVVQPVSITSGFPIVQPVSITSGFPVTQPVSIADGADITEGSTADAAVVTDASGTVSGKLRGLVRIFADVWDSGNHWIKIVVAGSSATSLGLISTGTNLIGVISTGTNLLGVVATGTNQIGSLSTSTNVIGYANPQTAFGKTITYVPVAQSAAGTTVMAVASIPNRHKIIGGMLTMSLAGTLKFNDGVVDLTGPMTFAANGGMVVPESPVPFTQTGAVNRAMNLVTTVGAANGVIAILTEP